MRIVPDPFCSLASGTCARKRISNSAAFAQVGVVNATWAIVRGSRLQRVDGERYKGDETFTNAGPR